MSHVKRHHVGKPSSTSNTKQFALIKSLAASDALRQGASSILRTGATLPHANPQYLAQPKLMIEEWNQGVNRLETGVTFDG